MDTKLMYVSQLSRSELTQIIKAIETRAKQLQASFPTLPNTTWEDVTATLSWELSKYSKPFSSPQELANRFLLRVPKRFLTEYKKHKKNPCFDPEEHDSVPPIPDEEEIPNPSSERIDTWMEMLGILRLHIPSPTRKNGVDFFAVFLLHTRLYTTWTLVQTDPTGHKYPTRTDLHADIEVLMPWSDEYQQAVIATHWPSIQELWQALLKHPIPKTKGGVVSQLFQVVEELSDSIIRLTQANWDQIKKRTRKRLEPISKLPMSWRAFFNEPRQPKTTRETKS